MEHAKINVNKLTEINFLNHFQRGEIKQLIVGSVALRRIPNHLDSSRVIR